MSDPKLKEAMAEISAILKSYDIGGHISLVSVTHSEFMYKLNPSWSCAWIDDNQIRFRSKKEDFTSKIEQQRVTELTTWLMLAIRDLAAQSFMQMESIEKMLREHFEIEHEPLKGFEPHREQ